MRFNRIAIIGVGLIGGSIGLAARRKKIAKEVIGVCRHKTSLRRASRIRAIDKGTLDYRDAVRNVDFVILATPVKDIIKIGKKIIPYLKKDCIIIDVGSTKAEIVQKMEKVLPKNLYFVGTHPLAGSEKKSAKFARADLFKDAVCILTKTAKTKIFAIKKVSAFWKKLGCRVKILSPQKHDRIVALTSHLPHLAATQLVKTAKSSLDFAARGFSDTTRIASSDEEIWTDIFLSNKRFLIQALDEFIKNLKLAKDLIGKENRKKLSTEFRKIKALRDALQK